MPVLIARVAEQRGERAAARLDGQRRVAIEDGGLLGLLPPGVFAGQQRVARGRAGRGRRVGGGEAQALRGQPVHVRGLDPRGAVAAEVAVAEVVGQDEDDVGLVRQPRRRAPDPHRAPAMRENSSDAFHDEPWKAYFAGWPESSRSQQACGGSFLGERGLERCQVPSSRTHPSPAVSRTGRDPSTAR